VLDDEIAIAKNGRLDFEALHPRLNRVRLLPPEIPEKSSGIHLAEAGKQMYNFRGQQAKTQSRLAAGCVKTLVEGSEWRLLAVATY